MNTDLTSLFSLEYYTVQALTCLYPLIFLSIGGVVSLFFAPSSRNKAMVTAVLTLVFSLVISVNHFDLPDIQLPDGVLVSDGFHRLLTIILLVISLFSIILVYGKDVEEELLPEIYPLMLFSICGMTLLCSTNNLGVVFISIEIMSLAVYVLVSMKRKSRASAEAGVKYFVLGGLSSGLLLYGTSLLFGTTGTFEISKMSAFLIADRAVYPVFYVGVVLVTAGFLFKIGAFPFHSWLPDVYQGAPSVITGFMGAAVKFASFIGFITFMHGLSLTKNTSQISYIMTLVLGIVAVLTMFYGNFLALVQTKLKRIFAYSTIAHTGYLLLGICAVSYSSKVTSAVVLYLTFYAFLTLGTFAIISLLQAKNIFDLDVNELNGLVYRSPMYAVLLTIFILSMIGMPLTSGFIGKYALYSSVLEAKFLFLVLIAIITNLVSVYYYLRLLVVMFLKGPVVEQKIVVKYSGALITAILCAFFTVQFGVLPKGLITLLSNSLK